MKEITCNLCNKTFWIIDGINIITIECPYCNSSDVIEEDTNEQLKTIAQLQQEYEARPIEEPDPFACDCERCVREQRRRVNER